MEDNQERNLIGLLLIMKINDIKPNFSELSKIYKLDRHTISKYYKKGGVPDRKPVVKTSKWDPYLSEIENLMNIPGSSKKGVYVSLVYKYPEIESVGNYNGFKAYTLRKGLECLKTDQTPHPLYENDPGEVLQADWVESLSIHLKSGELIKFNVFTAVLAYSRFHVFIYTANKTSEDLMRCTFECYKRIGGITKKFLTDNMSAIVSITKDNKKVHDNIQAFFKDLGVELKLCQVRSPETKGKNESANRVIKWVNVMDFQFESELELVRYIEEHMCKMINKEVNQTTHIPPVKLFQKEKEYLQPIGNGLMLDSYIKNYKHLKVPNTMLINYMGKRYSVPHNYIGKYVDAYVVGSELFIYHNSKLVTVHNISQSDINYKSDHYKNGMAARLNCTVDEIEEKAESNLKKLSKLGSEDY